jgi:hypothetical protein
MLNGLMQLFIRENFLVSYEITGEYNETGATSPSVLRTEIVHLGATVQ